MRETHASKREWFADFLRENEVALVMLSKKHGPRLQRFVIRAREKKTCAVGL